MPTELLRWEGGLNTSLHPTKIGEDELSDCENAIVQDGTARMDPRYIAAAQFVDDQGEFKTNFVADNPVRRAMGSGYAKYGSGLLSHFYVVLLHLEHLPTATHSVRGYYINLTLDPLQLRSIIGDFVLADDGKDVYFQQFANHLYGVNQTMGIGRLEIADADGYLQWELLRLPGAPAAPTASIYTPHFEQGDYTGGSITATGSASSSLTASLASASYSSAGTRTIRITFDTSPDLRPDWQYRDVIEHVIDVTGITAPPVLRIVSGTDTFEATPWSEQHTSGHQTYRYRLQNIARSNRTQVTALDFVFESPASFSSITIGTPKAFGVWLSLDTGTNPGFPYPGNLTFRPLVYEATYYNATTDFESPPSPQTTIPANQQFAYGNWVNLSCAATGAAGVSHVRFYRVVDEGGAPVRYLVAQVANSGSPATIDKYPLDYIQVQNIYTPSVIPITGVRAITAWQNRLAVSDGALTYISREDDPIAFVDRDSLIDLTDPARGFTFFPDDRKSETTLCLVGQDDLYIGTDFSIRCLIGNTPDNWRLLKLPDTEGVCGPRAMCGYKKGVLALTPSGRLVYHHSSLMEPVEVGADVRPRPDEDGISQIATADAVVEVAPNGDIWIWNQTGRYFVLSAQGKWRRGTHAHGKHSGLFVSGLPIRWLGTNGKLYEGGDDSFVSDGGTTGINGSEVEFSVTTRASLMPRSKVEEVNFGPTVQTLEEDGGKTVVRYPKCIPITSRQTGSVKAKVGKRHSRATAKDTGWKAQFKLIGGKDQVFEDVRVTLVEIGGGRNL